MKYVGFVLCAYSLGLVLQFAFMWVVAHLTNSRMLRRAAEGIRNDPLSLEQLQAEAARKAQAVQRLVVPVRVIGWTVASVLSAYWIL